MKKVQGRKWTGGCCEEQRKVSELQVWTNGQWEGAGTEYKGKRKG